MNADTTTKPVITMVVSRKRESQTMMSTQSVYGETRLLLLPVLLLMLLLTLWVSSTHGWISNPVVTTGRTTTASSSRAIARPTRLLLGFPQDVDTEHRQQQQQHQQHKSSILFHADDDQFSWRSLVQSCQSAAYGMALSGCILLAPLSPLHSHAAFAIDEGMVVTATSSTTRSTSSVSSITKATSTSTQEVSNVLRETSLPKPDAVGTIIDRSSMTISPPPKRQEQSSLDDVWSLIDKYYIDKTFNGQDWNQVKVKYDAKLAKIKSYKSNNVVGEEHHDMNLQKQNEQEMHLITEMVALLNDKYSRVLDVAQYTAIQKYDLIGVGVTLMPDAQKNIVVGAPPIAGSAADVAGLQLGDGVTAVNGIPTKGRTAFDIIDQISENPNAATVTMTITSSSSSAVPRDVVLSRTFQEIKNPVRYKISETRSDGTKVGFIRISEFNSLVKANLENALAALQEQGANAYVLDLRMNTGGAFQSAVEISSLFMEDRIATYVVDGANARLPFKTPKGRMAIHANIPMAVWIDGTSASASEVLAGSLHDNCRAILMGDQSFGKGLIQAVYGLKNGAGLVLTVARYVTPNGSDIQGVGIQPDIRGHVGIPIPGLSTDTSKVDFDYIKSRLDPAVCHIPPVVVT
jgi:carboxyl-terminal processing protease